MKFKVGLAFSGGIDSTFAAIYLKEMGYDVVAFNFPIGRNVDNLIYDTAKKLKIKLEIIDIRKIFEQVIKEDFYKSYLTGLTPNPCVRCNRYIKFGVLFNIVKNRYHMDFLATGHYAIIYKDENQRFFIKKAFDKDKDQSYFLWQINRLILKDIIFPLGNIKKSEIKSILLQSGFHEIAKKVESFDICFVNEQSYKRYIEKFGVQSSNKEGYFVDQKGNIVGKHQGIYRYTIGQRKGLNIAFGSRKYVRKINLNKNEVEIGEKPFVKEIIAKDINLFVSESEINSKKEYLVKIRYKSKEEKAFVKLIDENNKKRLKVEFLDKSEASSCGQSLVVYDNDVIIAGGIIEDYSLI